MTITRKQLDRLGIHTSQATRTLSIQHPEWLFIREPKDAWTDQYREDHELRPEDFQTATFYDRPDLLMIAEPTPHDPHEQRVKPPTPTPRGLEEIVMPHANPQGLWYGPSQDWFHDEWQQRSGCGPVSAALVTAYLAQKDAAYADLYAGHTQIAHRPHRFARLGDYLAHMETLWDHVTPTPMGTWKLAMYAAGIEAYTRSRGIHLTAEYHWVRPAYPIRRSEYYFEIVRDFVLEGLARDLPVAFLNYFGGEMRDISNWHWVTVTGARMTEDKEWVWLIVSDQGMRVEFSLNQWLYSSFGGGGFVRFDVSN